MKGPPRRWPRGTSIGSLIYIHDKGAQDERRERERGRALSGTEDGEEGYLWPVRTFLPLVRRHPLTEGDGSGPGRWRTEGRWRREEFLPLFHRQGVPARLGNLLFSSPLASPLLSPNTPVLSRLYEGAIPSRRG